MPRPAPIAAATDDHPEVQNLSVADLVTAMQSGRREVAVLDVRTDSEFAGGHISGARHEPSERFLENSTTGEGLAKEIVSSSAASGIKTLVVYCMYSQCRGPLIANTLAGISKAASQPVEIAILDGGFHKFLNSVCGQEGENVPGLVEGVQARKWRRTKTHGLVEEDAVQGLEQLTPTGAWPRGRSADDVKSLLKEHSGKVCLQDLDALCRGASPRLALTSDELQTLFAMAPNKSGGFVDWHEFVDYIYTGQQ